VLVEFYVLQWGFLSPKVLPLPTQNPDGPSIKELKMRKSILGRIPLVPSIHEVVDRSEILDSLRERLRGESAPRSAVQSHYAPA
jgi:hypothetical protein